MCHLIIPPKSYSHCVRQESGFCCIQYQTCASEMNAMSLNAQNAITTVDAACTSDYIGIPGKSFQTLSKYKWQCANLPHAQGQI